MRNVLQDEVKINFSFSPLTLPKMESSLESVRLKFTDLITHHLPSLTSLISLPELAQAETEINQLLERLRIQIQEFGLEVLDLETRREREDGGKEVEKLRGDWSR